MQVSFSFSTGEFRWKRSKSENTTPTKQTPRRPATIDMSENDLSANAALTRGLYHNTYGGLKLAGALAWAPIAIPVAFMGLPIPVTEDEAAQEVLDNIVYSFRRAMRSIHTQCHREGTVWVWPHYSARNRQLLWEFIPDESVSDIVRDPATGRVMQVITDEQITVTTDWNNQETVRRRRTFTPGRVETRWTGNTTRVRLEDSATRNPANVLPIPFANNRDGETIRGHSDYERIIPDLKAYSDVDNAQATMLAKFKVKMVQEFGASVDEWLANNGYSDLSEVKLHEIDLIMNKKDQESTTFEFPENAYEAYEADMKRRWRKVAEGSGIPEFLWGLEATGNHASVGNQADAFVNFVEDKREQARDPYVEVFTASMRLMVAAGELSAVPEFDITWDRLSLISDTAKSEIFRNYAQGFSFLIDAAGITKQQMHRIMLRLYPDATEDDFEQFVTGLADMAGHKQFKDADFSAAMDLQQPPEALDEQ